MYFTQSLLEYTLYPLVIVLKMSITYYDSKLCLQMKCDDVVCFPDLLSFYVSLPVT